MSWIPCVEIESASGKREVNLYTHQLMKRNIFLQGEINNSLANDFLNQIVFLENEGNEDISIFINSPGGEVTAGLMIYDLIQEAAKNMNINVYCTGAAYSMAALILASGQKGRRFILPHSVTMIHEPLIQSGIGGSATSIHTISDSIMETKKTINEILAKHTEKSIEEINKATAFDNYMDAQESINFGLCDEIKSLQ